MNIFHIIDRIKYLKNFKRDDQVADLLGFTRSALYTHKTRKTIPYEKLHEFCFREGISLNWLFTGEGPIYKLTADLHPDGNFVLIPIVKNETGPRGELIQDSNPELTIVFRREWILRRGEPIDMFLMRVTGDSMEPTLYSGDTVLVNKRENRVDPQGGIYSLIVDRRLVIRRLEISPIKEGTLRIMSDNPKYQYWEAHPDELSITGRVVWFARILEKWSLENLRD